MKELHNLLQQLTTINFKESNAPLIAESIENIIKDNYIENDLYIHSASVLAYYYGKNHRYNASMQWLNNIPANNYNHTWKVFKDTLIPIFRKNKEDEAQVAKMLETNLINLLKIDKLCVSNPLILDNSFHYGYIDVNPKSIIEKYSLLQMKAFPQISGCDYYPDPKRSIDKRIRLGIISGGLLPNPNPISIHSSSISDSFYSTLLSLPENMFEVIYIFTQDNEELRSTDRHDYIFIPPLEPNVDSVLNAQKRIVNLKLDILLFLDLHIYASLNWIALSKLAKIQMCTHGHPITSGIPRHIMNYFVSWEAAEIDDAQNHYTEELLLLPKNIMWELFIPRNKDNMSMVTGIHWGDINRIQLKELLPNIDLNRHWYFCAQAVFKYNYQFDIILKKIQEKDPLASFILIRNDGQLYAMNEILEKRLQEHGISTNVCFVEKMPHHIMMAVYNNVDVVLDSYFFGGDTTTREAFEVGSPVITLPHKYLGSRWTQAYYNHIGITDLIAKNIDDYVELAVNVATNPMLQKELRQNIKTNSYKIFHSKDASIAWANMFESVYNKICHHAIPKSIPKSVTAPKGGIELMLNRIKDLDDFSKFNILTTSEADTTPDERKKIYWCHDLPDDPIYTNIDKNSTFVFVSEYQKKRFLKEKGLDPENCFVIHNGIYPIKRTSTRSDSVCKLIYFSTPNRGLDILVTVFEKLIPIFSNNNINVHLDVYSSFELYDRTDLDTYYNNIFDKIIKHSNMTYHGTVSNEEIRDALSNADIFAFPSTHPETSCLCIIEAMSAGCICVHSSLAALPETTNGHTMMYPYTKNKLDHCTLFAKMLLESVKVYNKTCLKSQIDYANTKFNIHNIRQQWKNLFNKLKTMPPSCAKTL